MNKRIEFIALMLLAMVVSFLPFVSWPFMWVQTFFHEISHGLAAILTGGNISSIELHIRGSGVCYTQGGMRFIVAFSGYFGAAVCGMLFYLSVAGMGHNKVRVFSLVFGSLVVFSLVMWARDLITILIMLVIAALCFVPLINNWHPRLVQYFMQFIGCYILLDALKTPLYLIDGRSFGDGETLSKLTHLPEIVWVLVWEAAAVMCLYLIWKQLRAVATGPVTP